MEKTKIRVTGKRCMVCGKTYPVGTKRTQCGCEAHGRLYAVGICYSGGEANDQKPESI